jgi:hypothetical protein
MKILAIEKEIRPLPQDSANGILKQEALKVWELKEKNIIREIYFNEQRCAVLILECNDFSEARLYLEELPLVQRECIRFELMELRPYTGFQRLF